jgi:hypothetical protein
MIEVLRLKEKRHAAAKNLSGGQKRKLSVGIALIAGSKVCQHRQYISLPLFDFFSFSLYRQKQFLKDEMSRHNAVNIMSSV